MPSEVSFRIRYLSNVKTPAGAKFDFKYHSKQKLHNNEEDFDNRRKMSFSLRRDQNVLHIIFNADNSHYTTIVMKHLVCFLLLSAILFLSSCSPRESKKIPSKAVKGILDLRDWNFQSDGIIALDGEWEFFPNQFLQVAPLWEADRLALARKSIQVPDKWEKYNQPDKVQYGSYRLKVFLPNADTYLSFKLPTVSSAYSFYINGVLVTKGGMVGKSEDGYYPEYETGVFDFIHEQESIEIIVHISNFEYQNGSGIWESIQIGLSPQIQKKAKIASIIDAITFGILFIMAVYHFSYFFKRRKELAALYFGLFCLCVSFRVLFYGERIFFDIIPLFKNYHFAVRGEILFLFLLLPVFVKYLQSIFPDDFEKNPVLKILFYIGFFLSLIAAFTPIYIFTIGIFVFSFQLLILFTLLYIIIKVPFLLAKKREGAKTFTFGLTVNILTVANDILLVNHIVNTIYVGPFGFLAFVFSQSILLSSRFSNAFLVAEDLGLKLKNLNQDLEKKITERTEELEKEKEEIKTLNEMVKNLNETSDPETVLTDILTQLETKFGIEGCWLWLYDERNRTLYPYRHSFVAKELYSEDEVKWLTGLRISANSDSILSFLLKNPKTFYLQNAQKYLSKMGKVDQEMIRRLRFEQMLVIPLNVEKRTTGFLFFADIKSKSGINKKIFPSLERYGSQIASVIRNTALLKESNSIRAEINSLNEFTYLVNSLSSLNDIFLEISKYAYTNYNISGTWLFLPDERKRYLSAYKVYSYTRLSEEKYNYAINIKIPIQENSGGMFYKTFQRKKPFYLVKIPNSKSGIDKEIVEFLSLQSILHIPLVRKDECVGVLAFSNLENEMKLSKSDIRKISNLCSQIAGAVDTNHLLQQVKKAKKKTEDLNQLIKKVNETSDLENIMKIILVYVKNNYNFPYYSLFKLDSKGEVLKFANAVLPDYVTSEHKKLISSSTLSVTSQNMDSIHSRALALKTPVFIPDAETEIKTEAGRAILKIFRHKSFLTLPIILQNNPIGTLDFFSLESLQLREEEITELSLLAEQLAGVIQGATLFKQVQEEKEKALVAQFEAVMAKQEIEALNEFTKLINSTSDISTIFQEIYSYLNRTFGFTNLWVLSADRNKNELYSDANTAVYREDIAFDFDFFNNFRIKLDEKLGTLYQTYAAAVPLYVSDVSSGNIKTRTLINQFNGKTYSTSRTDFKIMSKGKLKSLLQIPLILQNEVIGIVCLSIYDKLADLSHDQIEKLVRFSNQIAGVIHNAQLLKQTEEAKRTANIEKGIAQAAQSETDKQRQETEALNKLIKSLNEDLDIKVIMQKVMEYVLDKFGIQYYLLAIATEDKERCSILEVSLPNILTESDMEKILRMKTPIVGVKGAHALTFKAKRPFYLPKVRRTSITEEEYFVIEKCNIESFLLIPLILQNEPIGFLDFFKDGKLELSKDDIAKLSILGEQLAGIIHGSNVFKQVQIEKEKALAAKLETENQKRETENLNTLVKSLNEELELKVIMEKVLKYVRSNFGLQHYELSLINGDKRKVKLSDISFPENVTDADRNTMLNLETPIDGKKGIHAFTMRSKKPFFSNKIQSQSNLNRVTQEEKFVILTCNVNSCLMIPLILQNEPIGLLNIYDQSQVTLSKEDITKLSILGEQLAGIIHGSNLFKQVQEEKEKAIAAKAETELARMEIQALNEFSKIINASNGLSEILDLALKTMNSMFSIDFLWLQLVDKKNREIYNYDYRFTDNISPPKDRLDFISSIKISLDETDSSVVNTYNAKKIIYLPDLRRFNSLDLSFSDKAIYALGDISFLLQVPLIVNEEVIGILHLNSFQQKLSFKKADLEKISRFAEQLSIAVNNSYLYEEAESERNKSEKLLLNILPKDVANELKEKGFAEPVLFENVSVMFTDFKGFTTIAETLTPQELIKDLDACFVQFDKITERFNLEKLKTIGDSYMCAGGIPRRNTTHAVDCCLAALEIQSFMNLMKELKEERGFPYWELRLGIHSGPLVAGVIGERKFAYDVWGDTVNTASRMESSGTPGKINISGSAYELVKEFFDCEYRGRVKAKNKGEVEMYYVNGLRPEYSKDGDARTPNGRFWENYGNAGM